MAGEAWYYETVVPRSFVLDDGSYVELTTFDVEGRLVKEPLFLLYVSPGKVEEIVRVLRAYGFEETALRVPKGERFSLVKRLQHPWELHVRIYEDGRIESEVEVSRDYLEYLGEARLYVVYETFHFYASAYDRLHILYTPKRRWVVEVKDHFHVRVEPPKTLTPWKPVLVAISVMVLVGLLSYALSRLSKGGENEQHIR